MHVPEHHKEIVKYLRERTSEGAKVFEYHDDHGKRRIHVASFGKKADKLISTVGACDKSYGNPPAHYEFAAFGSTEWLPNALVSSVYWLASRSIDEWPLVCEDVVRQNVRSPYRHMAYLPSAAAFQPPSANFSIRWLLGVPIRDSEISWDIEALNERARNIYPSWLLG